MKKVLDREVYYAGEKIFREGRQGYVAYLIESGEVALTKDGATSDEIIDIATIGPNTIFGEMAVIDEAPRMATATATTETVVVSVDQRELEKKLEAVDDDIRALFRFLLSYIRANLPYEERMKTFDGARETEQDKVARDMIASPDVADRLGRIDRFLKALFDILITYTERRLPPRA